METNHEAATPVPLPSTETVVGQPTVAAVAELAPTEASIAAVSTIVEEQAAPWRIQILFNKADLQGRLDAFWATRKSQLSPAFVQKAMKGYRTLNRDRVVNLLGGPASFYSDILVPLVQAEVAKKERELLTVAQLQIAEHGDKTALQVVGYLEPKTHFKGHTPPAKFKVSMEPLSDEMVTKRTSERIGNIQKHHTVDGKLPEVNDDLAISAGYENLAHMRTQFETDAEGQLTRERETNLTELLVGEILKTTHVDPIPDLWAHNMANNLVDILARQAGGEKQLLAQFRAETREQLVSMQVPQLRRQLEVNLALRHYGIKHGIQGETDLNSTTNYAQAVQRHIINVVEIVDGTPGELPALISEV